MRQMILAFTLALAPAAALAASLGVPLDQSALITLSSPAHNVIVGNPAIADVSVQDQRHVIVTGKGAGVTNLVITNALGRPIFNRQIVVGGSSADRVSLIRGPTVTRYACAPGCEELAAGQGGGLGGASIPSPAVPTVGTYNSPHPGAISASPNLP